MNKKLLLFVCTPILCLASCQTFNSDKNLHEVYKDYFTIGAALNEYNRGSKLLSHFNSMTCENAMKWVSVHPSDDVYTFAAADEYITIAKKNNIGVRGHALVWHHPQSLPADVLKDGDGNYHSKETILEKERKHVRDVVTHFGDDVYCWDVVNEVIDDGVSPLKEDGSNIYRQSDWYLATGRDFIKEAFIEADQTLKDLGIRDKVKLFYNDYDNTKPVKRSKTIAMLNWLLEEGVPIDGIGLQCHYHLGSFNMDELETSIIGYANLGLDVQITEFDCEIYDRTLAEIPNYLFYDEVPQLALDLHASVYDRAFEIFRRHKDKISNVTFWGVADNITYMNNNEDYGYRTNYPYIFDVFEEKKPAFYAITDYEG